MTLGCSDMDGGIAFASRMKEDLKADGWGFTDIVNTRHDQVWTEISPHGPVHMVWVDGGEYPESAKVRLYMKTEEDRDSILRVFEAKALTTPGIDVKKKKVAVTKKKGHENCNTALEVVLNRTPMAAVADNRAPGTLADSLYAFVRMAQRHKSESNTPVPPT